MNSRVQIVLRLVFILSIGYGGMYLILGTDFWLSGFWLIGFSIAGTINLLLYLERSKRELYNFLTAIKQYDFTQGSLQNYSPGNRDLRQVYKEIRYIFKTLHSEKESHHLFLQTIIQHIDTAIVVYNKKGIIEEANIAVKHLFGVPYFKDVQRLLRHEPELLQLIEDKNKEPFTYKIQVNGQTKILSVKTINVTILQQHYSLVSFQDIKNELEEKELDSWQKLIRILTHEIMNSTIPISTLASVIAQMIVDEEEQIKSVLTSEEKKDIYGGLKTIENRSKGLSEFVDSYRTLTKIKPPKLTLTNMTDLVDQNLVLLQNKLSTHQIKVNKNYTPFEHALDRELIDQVIINILINAIDALAHIDHPTIDISIAKPKEVLTIKICDNGSGIDQTIREDIFVPFFSTKKEGSGIGLSLARQIMRLHNGRISVSSELGKQTCFTLEF